eukprot:scaffold295_cov257-Pinguiococcus_pyrenoidosus.AAC.3
MPTDLLAGALLALSFVVSNMPLKILAIRFVSGKAAVVILFDFLLDCDDVRSKFLWNDARRLLYSLLVGLERNLERLGWLRGEGEDLLDFLFRIDQLEGEPFERLCHANEDRNEG